VTLLSVKVVSMMGRLVRLYLNFVNDMRTQDIIITTEMGKILVRGTGDLGEMLVTPVIGDAGELKFTCSGNCIDRGHCKCLPSG